ncbi:hypothetical protein Q5752_006495 [Cryptotrichosporon argae]
MYQAPHASSVDGYVLVGTPPLLPDRPLAGSRRLSLSPPQLKRSISLSPRKLLRPFRRGPIALSISASRRASASASASLPSLSDSTPTLASRCGSFELVAISHISDDEPAPSPMRLTSRDPVARDAEPPSGLATLPRPTLRHVASSPPAPRARRPPLQLTHPFMPIPVVPDDRPPPCPPAYPLRPIPSAWLGSAASLFEREPLVPPAPALAPAPTSPLPPPTSAPPIPRAPAVWLCSRPPSAGSACAQPTQAADSRAAVAHGPRPGLARAHSAASAASLRDRRAARPLAIRAQTTGHGARVDETGAVMYVSAHSERVMRRHSVRLELGVGPDGPRARDGTHMHQDVDTAEFAPACPPKARAISTSSHSSLGCSMYAQVRRASTFTLPAAGERTAYRGAWSPSAWDWRWVLL